MDQGVIGLPAVVAEFFRRHPECSFALLGSRHNLPALDLCPHGHTARFLEMEKEPAWIERYLAANRARFGGQLELPGWVLVDLYLFPGAIGLLTCPAGYLPGTAAAVDEPDEAIAAAYFAAPTLVPQKVVGVSLISLRDGIGAAAMVKLLTLTALRAETQQGIAQFGNASLRVHTRIGPLRILGKVPEPHPLARSSFLYSVDLTRHETVAHAMLRASQKDHAAPPGARWVSLEDVAMLDSLLCRAEAGDHLYILPPGLSRDGAAVLVGGYEEGHAG